MPSRRRRAIVALPLCGSKWRIEPWAWDGRAGLIFMPMARRPLDVWPGIRRRGRIVRIYLAKAAITGDHVGPAGFDRPIFTFPHNIACTNIHDRAPRVHCRNRRHARAKPQNFVLPRRRRPKTGCGSLQFHLATPSAINSLPRRWLRSAIGQLPDCEACIEGLVNMDFTLSPEIEDLRQRTRAFIEQNVLPLEADPQNFSEHENIPLARIAPVQENARKAGLWAPQSPKQFGGMALPIVAWAAVYEEAARSLFGPLSINCSAPDDGNMNLLSRTGTPAQQEWWLRPVVEGKVKSSFAMTEPAPGGGSDPGMIRTRAEKKNGKWVISGRKWFITGAGEAAHFIVIARTSDDKRRGLTAFLYHRDQPGWRVVRRIPIMGPEEHGGHCELEFDGLEIDDENVLLGVGDGLKVTQIRLGPARLTHCMRWLGG